MISPRLERATLGRLLLRLGLGFLLLLGTAWAVAETPWGREKLRSAIGQALREQLGLEARLAYVRLEPTLLPPGVELVARGIELSHPTEGRLAVASRLAVRPSLTRLLTGRLDLVRIELASPSIRLVIRDGELVNGPVLPESSSGGGASDLPFRYFSVTDASVRVAGDLPVSGVVSDLDAEVGVDRGRILTFALRASSGSLVHPRGTEEILALVAEGGVDIDRSVRIDRFRLRTTHATFGLRDGTMPLPFDHRANSDFEVRVDVGGLGPLFAEDLGVTLGGDVAVRGSFDWRDEQYTGTAHAILDAFSINGKRIGEPLELDLALDPEALRVERGRMHMPRDGGHVDLQARIGLSAPYPIEAQLDFGHMQLAALLDELDVTPNAIVRWTFDGIGRLRGQVLPFHLAGDIDVETTDFFVSSGPWHQLPASRIIGVPRGHIRGRVDIDIEKLSFLDLDLVTDHSRVRCDTMISFSDWFRVRATSDDLDLLDISPLTTFPLTGAGTLEVEVGGLYSDPQLDAHGFFRGFSFDTLPLGDVEVDAEFEEGGLVAHFPRIRGLHGDSRYVIHDLRLDFTEHLEIDALVELETMTFEDLYRTFHLDEDERFDPYSGVGRGMVHAHFTYGFPGDGPTGTLTTGIDVELLRTNISGYAFEDGRFRGELRWFDQSVGFDGAELDVDELTLRKGRGTVAVAGHIGLQGALDLSVVADRLAISDVEGLREDWPLLEGEVAAIGRVENTMAVPRLALDVNLSHVTWAGRTVGDGRAYVRLTDQSDPWLDELRELSADAAAPAGARCFHGRMGLLHANWRADPPRRTPEGLVPALDRPEAFVICGEGLDGALDIDLALGWTEASPHRGRISFRDLDLAPFMPAPDNADEPPFRGRVSGYVDLEEGDLETERSTTGHVHLDSFEIASNGIEIRERGAWDIGLVRGTANFEQAVLVGNGTELTLSGSAAADQLALTVEGSVGMELFAAVSPALANAAGATNLRLHLRGPMDDPEIIGEALFAGVSLQHESLPSPISGLEGRIEFSQRRVVFDGIHGHVGSGTVNIEGSATMEGGRPNDVDVRIGVRDIALRPDDGVEVAFGGDLRATWDGSAGNLPLLSGTVDLGRVRYTRPVQMTPTLGTLYRPERTQVDQYDPAGDFVQLDLRVVQDRPAEVRNNIADLDIEIEDSERPFRIVGTNQRPGAIGTLVVPRGQIFFRGSSFEVRRGTIELEDEHRIHPHFDLLAQTEIRRAYDSTAPAFRVQLAAIGDSDGFRLDASSTPSLSQQDIMLLLMVGMTSSELQNLQASQLSTTALDALSTLTGVSDRLSSALRVVDEVSLTTMYHPLTNRPEPQVTVGSRVSDRVRLTASTGLTSETRSIRTTAEWRIDEHALIQAAYDNLNRDTASTFGNLGVDVRYRLEFE